MNNLIWLVAIGALFFIMMRWGCGAGHRHGGHGRNRIDPPDREDGNLTGRGKTSSGRH